MIFNKEQELLRKAVRDFVSREMATLPEEIDKTGEMPRELLDKMAQTKYTSVTIPQEYGGAGADYVSYAIIMEELSRRCASTGTYATAAASLVSLPILNYGTERSEEHTSELQSRQYLVCRLLLEKKK